MNSNIIEAVNLHKKFGDFVAVEDINFAVRKGEIFGLLGPNGAGKTTTINMLIGLAKITDGKIFYNGKDLTKNINNAQNIIGVVADESNLYAEMSGFDNLCFCGALYGINKIVREKRAHELIELFDLTEFSHKKFQTYSKGMKRKLTIAAALIHQPDILFLDEPTSGIDVASVRQIRNLIKQLNYNGTSIFLTTHYIEEAERLCDRIAIINQGKIIKLDTVANLTSAVQRDNIVEIVFETNIANEASLSADLQQQFPAVKIEIKNSNTLKIISGTKINIVPFINILADRNIMEARLIKPSLEDAFVLITGIGLKLMKKEKEK
ncbi:MAG: ABC transporter [Candidatus Cloacimonas sp. SDB]|nr:MAG: ABC transporter [Candidatus Cloacimonas sp. SDB]